MPLAPPTIEEFLVIPLSKFITFALIADIVALPLKSLLLQFILSSWKISWKQEKRIIPIGIKPWMDHLHMNIWNWKMDEKEIDTQEGMVGWDVVECQDYMNAINWTWAFNCKQFPNGTLKKFKACICACENWTVIRDWFLLDRCPCCPMNYCLSEAYPWGPEIKANWCYCCLFSCYSLWWWKSLCGDFSWLQAAWFK